MKADASLSKPRGRGPGKPFGTGQPVPKSPGRPVLTPEQRLTRRVQARVITDVAQEMRAHAEAAVEALRDVIDKGEPSEIVAASRLVLSYAFGNPRDTIDMTLNPGIDRITPDMLRSAALRVAGRYAETVE